MTCWRGEKSLAWVFWCYYVLGGFVIVTIQVALLPLLISDLVQLVFVCSAFILFVRCIANVKSKGWQYATMVFLLGVSHQVVEQARDIGNAIFA